METVIREKRVSRTEILGCYEWETRSANDVGKLISVSRSVTLEGKEIYKDMMSSAIYCASQDPIRKLELFLLGVKDDKSRENVSSNIQGSPKNDGVGVIGTLIERLAPLSKSGSITAKDGVTTISFLLENKEQALSVVKDALSGQAWCYSVAKKGKLMELSVHLCSVEKGGQNG